MKEALVVPVFLVVAFAVLCVLFPWRVVLRSVIYAVTIAGGLIVLSIIVFALY